MKRGLTKQDIINLVSEGNAIRNPQDFTRLNAIGRKYGLSLIYDKQTNLNLVWNVWREKLEALTEKDSFRSQLAASHNWHLRNLNPDTMRDFIAYLKVTDEWEFLSDPAWDRLYTFATYTLSGYGLPTEGGVTPLLKAELNYFKYLSQFDFSKVDKEALATSKKLKASIEQLFEGMEYNQRVTVGNLVLQYSYSAEGIEIEEFHNQLFKNS